MQIRHRRADLATAAAMLAGEIALFANTFTFPRSAIRGYPGAAFFPRIILTCLVLFTLAIAYKALTAPRAAAGQGTAEIEFPLGDFAATLAAGLAFAVLITPAGFELTLFLITFALLWQRIGSLWKAALASVATVIVAWAVFVLFLGISAPVLFLPQYIEF